MANDLTRRGTEFNAVLPPHGSIAKEMQALLWRSHVVTAFHLVPAAEFGALDEHMESDVVACGDDDDARMTLMEIIRTIPDLRAFDGGSLENAVGMETFAAVLLTINIRHKVRAGLAGAVFREPETNFRVVAPDVGGGFGMKGGVYPEDALVTWAARKIGRPVKWVAERSEGLLSDSHGRDCISTASLALDAIAFTQFVKSELERWTPIAKAAQPES